MEQANFRSKHTPYRRGQTALGTPHYLFKFRNGYGASLVYMPRTGNEITLIYWINTSQYALVDTALVRKFLTYRAIEEALDEILALPPRSLF